MTCEQCRDELADYALGQCAPVAEAAAREHLATCAACRQELAEVESAWTTLPQSLPGKQPSSALFQRVLDRIEHAGDPQHSKYPATVARPQSDHALTPRQRRASYMLAATVLVALVAGSLYIRGGAPFGKNAANDRALHQLAAELGRVQELEQLLRSSDVKLASLMGPSSPNGASAYVLWDTQTREWHVFASNLPAPPPGQAYQLWAITGDGRTHPGPTFGTDRRGNHGLIAHFPELMPGNPVKAVVTLESEAGAQSPSTKIMLEAPL